MVRPVAGDLPEQVKNNQSVNMAAGNGGQKMSQYPWFTVYAATETAVDVPGKTASGRQRQGRGSRMRHSRIYSCISFGFCEKHL